MLEKLVIFGLLSFSSDELFQLDLRSLNVLVGPNGVGKSNLLEIVGLLRALPTGIHEPLLRGGAQEWLHKGLDGGGAIGFFLRLPDGKELEGSLALTPVGQALLLTGEQLGLAGVKDENDPPDPAITFLRRHHGPPIYLSARIRSSSGEKREMVIPEVNRRPAAWGASVARRDGSVLEQFRDPERYPELTYVAERFERIFFFRNWSFGPSSRLRQGVRADELSGDFLAEDASNLAHVLHELRTDQVSWNKVLDALQKLYAGADDIHVSFTGGVVQFFLLEGEEKRKMPASRLSDGTLRYLALVAMLCHPSPPPLLCIEEPELGLHPDLMPTLAELLRDASTRTQLLVTTHSEALIDALSDTPESVVVCEPGEDGTTMRRLENEELKGWLERYKLGQLWRRGDIGGNRW